MIPGPRTAPDDQIDDAELHAEVARIFAEQAETARRQSRFLLTVQTAGSNGTSAFRAAVADYLQQQAAAERKLAQDAKESAR